MRFRQKYGVCNKVAPVWEGKLMKKKVKSQLHKKFKQYEVIIGIALAVLIAYGSVVYMIASSQVEPVGDKRLVTFYDQGVKRVVLTHAETIEGALKDAGISIKPRDETEPSLKTKLSASHADVIIYRSRLIAIHDGQVRQSVLTVAQSPNAILKDAKLKLLNSKDEAEFVRGNFVADGTATILKIDRAEPVPKKKPKPQKIEYKPKPNALTASKGAHVYVDSQGVAHRETYYDLPMNIVIGACGPNNNYTIRPEDGAKIDKDGYVLVAANYGAYPRCSVVDTSLGPGKVYDTGGFALRHPYGFDLATDWTNYNGQ